MLRRTSEAAGVQAISAAQQHAHEPTAWRESFVRAVNHLTGRSAKDARSSHPTPVAGSAGRISCSGSQTLEIASQAAGSDPLRSGSCTSSSVPASQDQARGDRGADDLPAWDKSSQRSGPAARATGAHVGDLLVEFPDLKLVHSGQSLAALVERQAAALQARRVDGADT